MIETSQEIGELAKALSAAQSEIMGASKDAVNPFFSKDGRVASYATLASVWEACRVPLTKNGLSVAQLPTNNGTSVGVVTTLMHTSGQWMRSALYAIPEKQTPQALGSAITYCRRYALAAVAGVAPEDDDGNEASGRTNGGKPEAAGGAQRANKVPATNNAKMADGAQIKVIHILKERIGGWTGESSHGGHPYKAALLAYKDAKGEPVTTSKDLTFDQAANLIQRMEGMVSRQQETARKMEQAAPIGDNADREPGADDDDGEAPDPGLLQNVREACTSHWGKKAKDLAPQWLEMEYGVKSTGELTKYQATNALQRLLSGSVL